MKRVRIIYKGTVASAPLADKSAEMPNAEVLARLLNDVLNAPVPESLPLAAGPCRRLPRRYPLSSTAR